MEFGKESFNVLVAPMLLFGSYYLIPKSVFAFLASAVHPIAPTVAWFGLASLGVWLQKSAIQGRDVKGLIRDRRAKTQNCIPFKNDLMSGKTVVVTGGSAGLGLEVAAQLLGLGARVIVTGTPAKDGEAAAKKAVEVERKILDAAIIVMKEDGVSVSERAELASKLHYHSLDLGNFDSISTLTAYIKEAHPNIDILVNNAAVLLPKFTQSKYGPCEDAMFFANAVGVYYLTESLLPFLKGSSGNSPRIINVASGAHIGIAKPAATPTKGQILREEPFVVNEFLQNYESQGDGNTIQKSKTYSSLQIYALSKLVNIFHAQELAARHQTAIVAMSLHPGGVSSSLFRSYVSIPDWLMHSVMPLMMKTPRSGAQTVMYCCLEEGSKLPSGGFYSECAHRPHGLSQVARSEVERTSVMDWVAQRVANIREQQQNSKR